MQELPYDNIREGKAVKLSGGIWTEKAPKRDAGRYERRGTEFVSDSGASFDTGCEYVFVTGGRLIGYDEPAMKFYAFTEREGGIFREELSLEEIQAIFNKFSLIKLSEFSTSTNSFRYNRKAGGPRVMLINDGDYTYPNYVFTTNNAKIKLYSVNNAVEIDRGGMIQFTCAESAVKECLWFVLLTK